MPNPYFQFKQFVVRHDQCAMKVGTDGVTLGAWVRCEGASSILDVGCGSGLIALMLAQRNSDASIVGIDIDDGAVAQSEVNFAASRWADRLCVVRADIRSWSTNASFDLIVSNPPYFVNSLQAPDTQRNTARHALSLTHSDLLKFGHCHLSVQGRLAVILPPDEAQAMLNISHQYGLAVARTANLFTSAKALQPKRTLMEFQRLDEMDGVNGAERLVIGGNEYKSLVNDFYL